MKFPPLTFGGSACTLKSHDAIDSLEEFERQCENIRPWPGEDMIMGECKKCHSTLAWYEEDEEA